MVENILIGKNMNSLLNKKQIKEYILKKCGEDRPGWSCERISQKAINQIEIFLKRKIIESVKRHPTIGKTFMYFE